MTSLTDPRFPDGYDPVAYWRAAGPAYEASVDSAGYRPQEDALAATIDALPWESVLDVGCGFGRLGEMIQRIRPDAEYVGFDVSPDQIAAAKRRVPGGRFTVASLAEYDALGKYDLVITAEVLMHQPARDIEWIIEKMLSWSQGHVVSCDWHEPGHPGNDWNVPHDYAALYGGRLISATPVGPDEPWCRQSIFVAAP